jgi:hypothetical protein
MDAKEITITRFDNAVPPFVEAELERLYGSVFSSVLQFQTYGSVGADTSAYVVRQADRIITLLLFRVERGRVQVLNEVFRLKSEEIARFAEHIFAAFRSVNVVSFHAIETDVERLAFPFQRFNCLEDIAMPLPGTRQEYLASLGKNTRRNIKRYTDRLNRAFPSFRYEAFEKQAVDGQQVRDIIGFNRARMADKDKVSGIDEEETQRIIRVTKACGMVGAASIGGRICAGTISYRTGDNYFLYVLAHDPAYDDYWIGILCCYLTICECIARGGKEFHFLWGAYDYKFTLGAVRRELDHVTIYRSRAHILLNGKTALQTLFRGYVRRAKLWLQYGARHQDSPASIIAPHVLNLLRRLRRFASACANHGNSMLSRLGYPWRPRY